MSKIEKGYITVKEDLFIEDETVTSVWRKGTKYSYEIDESNIKIWSDLVGRTDGRWNHWLKSSKPNIEKHMIFVKEN